MTNGSLMKGESIAEGSPSSILQYFWPAFSDNWSWKPIFFLLKSGRFTEVLLYVKLETIGAVSYDQLSLYVEIFSCKSDCTVWYIGT